MTYKKLFFNFLLIAASLIPINLNARCLGILTKPEEVELASVVSRLNEQYLLSSISEKERVNLLKAQLEKMNIDGDKEKAELREALVSVITEIQKSQLFFEMIVDRINGIETPEIIKQKIIESDKITLEEFESIIDEEVQRLGKYYASLVEHGISYVKGKGWDFSNANITIESLKDPTFNTATILLISEKFSTIADPYRSEAIVAGDYVYLPIPKQGTTVGTIPKVTLREYKIAVHSQLNLIDQEVKRFLVASREAASYWNMMSGWIYERVGFNRGGADQDIDPKTGAIIDVPYEADYEDLTPPEIDRLISLKQIESIQRNLVEQWGIDANRREVLARLNSSILQLDTINLEAGVKVVQDMVWAAILSPAAAYLLYIAPIAAAGMESGGIISPLIASGIVSGTKLGIGIPIGISLLNTSISTYYDTKNFGGDWFCHFKDHFVSKGSNGLFWGTIFGALPLAAGSAAGGLGIALKGKPILETLSTGEKIIRSAPGLPVASTTFAWFNGTVAATFLGLLGYGGTVGIAECADLIKKGNSINQTSKDFELATAYYNEGIKLCWEAGIDLSFAAYIGWRFGGSAYRGYKYRANSQVVSETKLQELSRAEIEELVPDQPVSRETDIINVNAVRLRRDIELSKQALKESGPEEAELRTYIQEEIKNLELELQNIFGDEIDHPLAFRSSVRVVAAPTTDIESVASLDIPPTPSIGNMKYRPLSLRERFLKWGGSRGKVQNLVAEFENLNARNNNKGTPAWQRDFWELLEALRGEQVLDIIRGRTEGSYYSGRKSILGLVDGAERLLGALEGRWRVDLERSTRDLKWAEETMGALSRKEYPCVQEWRDISDEHSRNGWRFLKPAEKQLVKPKRGKIYVPEEARREFDADVLEAKRAREIISDYLRIESEVFDRLYAVMKHRLSIGLILEELAPKNHLIDSIKGEGRDPTEAEGVRINELSDELTANDLIYLNGIKKRIEAFFEELKKSDASGEPYYGRYIRDLVFKISDKIRYDAEVAYTKPDPRWVGRMLIQHWDWTIQALDYLSQKLPRFKWTESLSQMLKQIRVEFSQGEIAKLLEKMNEEITLELRLEGNSELILREISTELKGLKRAGSDTVDLDSMVGKVEGLEKMHPEAIVDALLKQSAVNIEILRRVIVTKIMQERGIVNFDPSSEFNPEKGKSARAKGDQVSSEYEKVVKFMEENGEYHPLLKALKDWRVTLDHIVTLQTAGGWKGRVERGFYIKLIHGVLGIALANWIITYDGDTKTLEIVNKIINEILEKNKKRWLTVEEDLSETELMEYLGELQVKFEVEINDYIKEKKIDEKQAAMIKAELSRRVYEELLKKLIYTSFIKDDETFIIKEAGNTKPTEEIAPEEK